MKQGKTINELAVEIRRQSIAKKDYLVETTAMSMLIDGDTTAFNIDGVAKLGINEIAHQQIGQFTEIPWKYYDKMRTESPRLLVESVNHWLYSDAEQRRMIRTLDGNMRAFLSDRYRRIDNEQVAEIAGCTQTFISKMINGFKMPSAEMLLRIADHYHCTVDDLIREEIGKNGIR